MAKGRDRWAVFPKPKLTPASIAEKKTKKLTCITFLCMIALRNKTVVRTFLLLFNNANGHPFQEKLLRPRNFVTMVT